MVRWGQWILPGNKIEGVPQERTAEVEQRLRALTLRKWRNWKAKDVNQSVYLDSEVIEDGV